MIKKNYYQLMIEEIESVVATGEKPHLLLHICCAPCSSYVVEYLMDIFKLTLYFYDPNIQPYEEYAKRRDEAIAHSASRGIEFIEGPYDVEKWFAMTKGHENDEEKGERCDLCFEMRLGESARLGFELGCDYFTSVLSVSPHKNSVKINEAGFQIGEKSGLKYLPADFKKKEGFKKSMELSRKYGYYRQDYCGCVFSKR